MNFNEYLSLQEGINDPAIFKVIFLAGGPGSGKSFMVKKTALQAMGFTVVNSDNAFEHLLKKNNLSMKMPESEKEQRDLARDAAKESTNKKQELALQGRLGMVIDGTGRDYDKIKKLSTQFQKQGYDTSMIFVNTDLETAVNRNAKRDRSVPEDMVKKLWTDVQGNIGKFQSGFGNNFHVIDNSEGADFDEQTNRVFKDIGKWSKQPPKNNVAKKWIDSQKGERPVAKETPAKKQTSAEEETPAPKSNSQEAPPVDKKEIQSQPKEAPPESEPKQGSVEKEPYKVKCLDKRPPHGAKMANVLAKNEQEALKKVRAHGLVPVEINGRSLKEEAETTMKAKDPCWKDYEMIGTKKKNGREVPNCVPKEEACCDDCVEPLEEDAEYEGRKVTLNKPFGGDSKHKRYVYVKNEKGNIIKLGFGDPNMEIKRDDPERRKAYRARHNCDNPGPKWKANYWSCKYWSSTPTSKLDEVSIPMYVQEAAYTGNIGMMELAKFYMKANETEKKKLQDLIKKEMFKQAWKMVQDKTGIKLVGKEFATESGVMKKLGEGLFGISSKDKGRIMNIASNVSDDPGNWDHKKQTFTNKGEVELSKQLKGNRSHIKYAKSLRSKDYEAFESVIEDNFGEMLGEETTVYVPLRFKRKEDSIYAAIHKAHGSPAKHNIGVEFNNTGKREVHVDGKKHSKLTIALNKHLDNLKEDTSVEEEAPANSVSGGGVDMNPTGKPKWDKRSKFHIDHMFRRADGTKYKKNKTNE